MHTKYTVSVCWVRTLSSSTIPFSNENNIPRLQFQYQYHHCHSTISVSVSISLNGIPRFRFQYQYQRIKSCDINTPSIPIPDRYCGFNYGILFGFNSIAHPCFQGFRICINCYPISKNELARLNLLSEHLGARFRVFCQISWVEQWTFWGVCQFLARNQCPRPFYHKESTKLHWHSYQKPLLLLTYLIPYVNASSWKTQLI